MTALRFSPSLTRLDSREVPSVSTQFSFVGSGWGSVADPANWTNGVPQ